MPQDPHTLSISSFYPVPVHSSSFNFHLNYKQCTVMHHIMTFWSMTDHIYDSGPIRV